MNQRRGSEVKCIEECISGYIHIRERIDKTDSCIEASY